MGKPGFLKKPRFDRGGQQEELFQLFEDLHGLHLNVGLPSLAKIAQATEGRLSKSTIGNVMSEPRLPDLGNLREVVAALVKVSPFPLDLDDSVMIFVNRWRAAAAKQAAPPSSPRVQKLLDTANAYLKLAQEYAKAEAMESTVHTPRIRALQWDHVADLSFEVLGPDHPISREAWGRAGRDEMLSAPAAASE